MNERHDDDHKVQWEKEVQPEPGTPNSPAPEQMAKLHDLHLLPGTVFTARRKVLPTVQVIGMGYLNPQPDITNLEMVWLCAMFAVVALPAWHTELDWPAYIELHGLRRHFTPEPPAGHGQEPARPEPPTLEATITPITEWATPADVPTVVVEHKQMASMCAACLVGRHDECLAQTSPSSTSAASIPQVKANNVECGCAVCWDMANPRED